MSEHGWYFTGAFGTPKIMDDDGGNRYMNWQNMETPLLSEMLHALTTHNSAGDWHIHIKYLKEVLNTRVPPTIITSVTINGKL